MSENSVLTSGDPRESNWFHTTFRNMYVVRPFTPGTAMLDYRPRDRPAVGANAH